MASEPKELERVLSRGWSSGDGRDREVQQEVKQQINKSSNQAFAFTFLERPKNLPNLFFCFVAAVLF